MKGKIILLLTILLCAGKLFALDASARTVVTGNFVEETKRTGKDAKFEFFKLTEKPQKDDDGIVFEIRGEKFGGRLGLWYPLNAANSGAGSNVSFRRSNLWVQPIKQLRFTIGYVGNDQLYKERLYNWKVGSPFRYDKRDWSAHPGYINNSDVDDMGFGLEVRPIDGLIFTAGIARRWGTPGSFGKPFFTSDDGTGSSSFDAWGVTARYYWKYGLCFQGSFRDNGSKQWKVARAAVGFENENWYAFVQPCFGIDYITADQKYKLTGICFDLYGEYHFDAWTFFLHVPVTLRTSGEDASVDPSYMEFCTKVMYNFGTVARMDDLSAYIKVGSMTHDGDQKFAFYQFNNQFADSLNFDITPGVSFAVGPCKFDTGFTLQIHSKLYADSMDHDKIEWNIPFTAEIRF